VLLETDADHVPLAIATQAAEAAYKATKDIPIVITAVTDPVAIGLADSLEHPGKNVTGTHDMNPIKEQLELLKEILPMPPLWGSFQLRRGEFAGAG